MTNIGVQDRPIETIMKLARNYWDMNKYEAALEQSAEALRIDPEHYDALYVSGWNCYELARYDEALEFGRLLMKQQPKDYYVHRLFGLIYKKLERYGASIEALTRSLELNPNGAVSHYHLAVSISEQAVHHFGNQTYRRGWFPWSRVKWKKKLKEKLDESCELLRTSIRLNPQYGWSYSYLSYILRLLGRTEEAERLIVTALELEPQNADFLAEHGAVLKDSGKLEEAKEAVKAAGELDPTNDFVIFVHKDLSRAQDRYINYLRNRIGESVRFAKLYDNDPDIWLRAIRLTLLEKKITPVLMLKKYLSLRPEDLEMSMHYGRTLYEGKFYRQAIEHFKQCSEQYPGHPQIEAWVEKVSRLTPGEVRYRRWIANPLRTAKGYTIYALWLPVWFIISGIPLGIIYFIAFLVKLNRRRADRKKSLSV